MARRRRRRGLATALARLGASTMLLHTHATCATPHAACSWHTSTWRAQRALQAGGGVSQLRPHAHLHYALRLGSLSGGCACRWGIPDLDLNRPPGPDIGVHVYAVRARRGRVPRRRDENNVTRETPRLTPFLPSIPMRMPAPPRRSDACVEETIGTLGRSRDARVWAQAW